jgi:hypothetical protein
MFDADWRGGAKTPTSATCTTNRRAHGCAVPNLVSVLPQQTDRRRLYRFGTPALTPTPRPSYRLGFNTPQPCLTVGCRGCGGRHLWRPPFTVARQHCWSAVYTPRETRVAGRSSHSYTSRAEKRDQWREARLRDGAGIIVVDAVATLSTVTVTIYVVPILNNVLGTNDPGPTLSAVSTTFVPPARTSQ